MTKPAKIPYLKVVTITPELAGSWLDKMGQNRNVNDYRVQNYATSVLKNSWLLTQPLEFDWNGEPINGQHRLRAVVESGVAVEMLILFDVDPKAKEVIDSHRPRSNTDIKTIVTGVRSDPKLMPTLTMIDSFMTNQRQQMNYRQMAELETRFKGSLDWVFSTFKNAKSKLVTTTPVRAAFAFAYLKDPYMIGKLAQQVLMGSNLKETDVAYMLRHYLMEGPTIKKDDRRNQGLKVLTAIRAFVEDEPLKRIFEKVGIVNYFASMYPEIKVASLAERFESLRNSVIFRETPGVKIRRAASVVR